MAVPDDSPFFNRDLSWLDFNARVLAQAEDDRLPLLERVKFCAIYSSNLDEFFMKRIGLLKRRLADPDERDKLTPEGLTLNQLHDAMRDKIVAQKEAQAKVFVNDLLPSLHDAGIHLLRYADLSKDQRAAADAFFDQNVFPVLTPLAVDPSHRFPFISNLSENYGLFLAGSARGGPRLFARVKIPSVVPRYIRVPLGDQGGGSPAGGGTSEAEGDARAPVAFIQLDDLVAQHLPRLFPGSEIEATAAFRITRSATLEEEDEDDEPADVLQQVADELRKRRFAQAVRLEASNDAPEDVLQYVTNQLGLTDRDIYRRDGPLEYQDLWAIAKLPRPELKERPWTPVTPPALHDITRDPKDTEPDPDRSQNIFDRIRERDIFVHHPYESFDQSVERFVAEASRDPDVVAIKQTIYRTTPDSPFVRSLIRAAEAGKNVACLVELRARFDEERNVSFARQLEHAGVHVAYGVIGLKTHCKLSLVVRREPGPDSIDGSHIMRSYAHIGTGNYHPGTAQLYTDMGILTADPRLTEDAVKVFNTLTGHAAEQSYESMLVAPEHMRTRFETLIDREIRNAQQGRPARIIAKMNSLEDRAITKKLYEASAAGVKINLYVRGFCCLRPQVPGLSENIKVTSVIGRFLEHSRIFYFANGNETRDKKKTKADPLAGDFYISSADWMYRNLNNRVETATPILDREARAVAWHLLETHRRDRFNAWDLGPDGNYTRREPDKSAEKTSPERDGTFAHLMACANETAGRSKTPEEQA